jgi:hypothetical protein
MGRWTFLIVVLAADCTAARPFPVPPTTVAADTKYDVRGIPLPGGTGEGVFMDGLLYDDRTNTVWVPAGNAGSVDVIEIPADTVTQIEGFPTQEVERHGQKRMVGPSAATLGDGVVYIGNRGDRSVCSVDEVTLKRGKCGTLDAMPDALAYVADTREVWVTTPRDKSIRILDGTTLAQKARLAFAGAPEGFAVDASRGRIYTNLEDADRTLGIDIASRKTLATWDSHCGAGGPHGLRVAVPEGFLFVACSAQVEVLDVLGDGAVLGAIDTGDGVDDLEYAVATHRLYIGAAHAAKLTIAGVSTKGTLALIAVVPTKAGARNGVVDATGSVYLANSQGAELVVVTPIRQ